MRAHIGSILLAAAFAALAAVPAARAQNVPSPNAREEGAFDLILNQDYAADGTSVLVVGIAVPYRRLVFFFRSGKFESSYRVYLELYDDHGKRVRGEVWEESVSAGVFRETTSGGAISRSSRRFPLTPGEYRAVVTVEVIGTSRRATREDTIRITGGEAGRLDLSAPAYLLLRPGTAAAKPPAGEIAVSLCPPDTTAIGRQGPVFGIVDAFARVRYTVDVPAGAVGGIVLSTRIRDAAGTLVRYQRRSFSDLAEGHVTICLEMNLDDFRLGLYTIESVVESAALSQRRESEGRFTLILNRALFDTRVGDLESILGSVAGGDEVRAVVGAPPAERFDAWSAFWRKRDPTPSSAGNEAFGEFMGRLRHVIERYSRREPGWRTDRGRTYLADGPPDKIETTSELASRNYELWYYYTKGIVYVFEDLIGTGDYRLLTTRMI